MSEPAVATRDAAEVLEPAEHGLRAPAILVAPPVVADRALAGARARGHRHDTERAQVCPEPIGVVSLVGQQAPDVARAIGGAFTKSPVAAVSDSMDYDQWMIHHRFDRYRPF